MKDSEGLLVCALIAALGLILALAWALAHSTVARECERLGAFYVGDKVYECRLKTTNQGETR
jgi:hypothetical protein